MKYTIVGELRNMSFVTNFQMARSMSITNSTPTTLLKGVVIIYQDAWAEAITGFFAQHLGMNSDDGYLGTINFQCTDSCLQ